MHSESHTIGAEQVSQNTLAAICKLTLSGSTLETISLAFDLDQEGNQCEQAQLAQETVLQAQSEKTQANTLNRDLAETSLQDTSEALLHLQEVPTFIYSYKQYTDQLHRTSLVTGEHSSIRVPPYRFKGGCSWSELPGGSLLITGGETEVYMGVREVSSKKGHPCQ
jgi:hypothetical protein